MSKIITILSLLFAFVSPVHAISPESGWWWNPSASGSGYNIEIQDNVLAVSAYVFDTSGAPTYFISAGAMSNDSTYAGSLDSFSGGQCIGCAYKAPRSVTVGTISIKFSTAQSGTLTINGGVPIPIQRLAYGMSTTSPYPILGEWATTEGSRAYPIYFGERIQFPSTFTSSSDGRVIAAGARSGTSGGSNTAVAYQGSDGVWNLLLDSSTSYYKYYRFTFSGLNSIEGTCWTYLKTSSPSEFGLPFIAFRSQSASLVKTGVGPGARAQALGVSQNQQATTDTSHRDQLQSFSPEDIRVNADAAASDSEANAKKIIFELQQFQHQ